MAYRGWAKGLPPEVEVVPVELPGRASRFHEPAFRHMDELIEPLAAGLAPLLDRPAVFFGHSMGALIAFEFARWLRREGREGPRLVFASAKEAPHIPDDEPPIHKLPDPELTERLRSFNGTPEEVLQHPELMAMLLPLIRADFELNETYVCRPEAPLACPITALGGLEDPDVSQEELAAWKEHTTCAFQVRMFAGDHFYLLHNTHQLFRALMLDLAPLL